VTVGAVESLAGTTVTTSLANRNFTGATIAGANFANANIVGATNLPAFSTTQKLQLLRGTDINAAITTPVPTN
jgi:hypothetical protein